MRSSPIVPAAARPRCARGRKDGARAFVVRSGTRDEARSCRSRSASSRGAAALAVASQAGRVRGITAAKRSDVERTHRIAPGGRSRACRAGVPSSPRPCHLSSGRGAATARGRDDRAPPGTARRRPEWPAAHGCARAMDARAQGRWQLLAGSGERSLRCCCERRRRRTPVARSGAWRRQPRGQKEGRSGGGSGAAVLRASSRRAYFDRRSFERWLPISLNTICNAGASGAYW